MNTEQVNRGRPSLAPTAALAADPRYHFGSQIKIKSVYIDSLMNVTPGAERAPMINESRKNGLA